jgi:long-chain acyl-CoA synthetase
MTMSAFIDRTTPIAAKPIPAILAEAVGRFPDRPALDFLGRHTSYAELGRLVDLAARGFQQLGVKKGVRVGLCLPNTPYFLICYYAILKAGGTVVNFNPLYVEPELQHLIEDSGTTLMVTLDIKQIYPKVARMLDATCLERIVVCRMGDLLPAMQGLLFGVLKRSLVIQVAEDLRHIPFARLLANDGTPKPVEIDPRSDTAILQYTGGTTGLPKAAMLTHANVTANTDQLSRLVPDIRLGEERMLAVLPLFHVFAMTVAMNLGISFGAELILLPRFELEQVLKCIAKKRPTLFPGVPTIYSAINAASGQGHWDLSSIRCCISGGAPLPREVRSRFEQLAGCQLVEGYGLSEASPVVSCNPFFGEVKDGSVGLPLPGTVVEIRSPTNPAQCLPPGEKGEVCVRGPQVMAGYWQRPDDNAQVFVEGSLRTGDIGYFDGEGYLFLVDRMKDVIICGGYNVYPRVIEEALYQHPAVADAAVIGIPDSYRGEAPKAFVVLRDGAEASAETLKDYLAGQISRIEMPKEIELRDQLPKTMVGKLSKKELLAEERARLAASGLDRAS